MSLFTDWLKTNDGCIVVFPKLVSRSRVIDLLTEKLKQEFVLVTELNNLQRNEISYDDYSSINAALKINQLVIFDDIKMLSLVIDTIDSTEVRANIIILTTWGDEFGNLNPVTIKFPNSSLFYLNLIRDATIDWHLFLGGIDSVQDGIISNWPRKQLVLTFENEEISVLPNNSYEPHEIISISHLDKYEIMVQKINMFNSLQQGVLITNIVPILELQNVSVVHITEPNDIRMLLPKCCCRDIFVKMYFAEITEQVERMLEKIKEANRFYSGLVLRAQELKFEKGNFLV